jgi:hypothetical protein
MENNNDEKPAGNSLMAPAIFVIAVIIVIVILKMFI